MRFSEMLVGELSSRVLFRVNDFYVGSETEKITDGAEVVNDLLDIMLLAIKL